jgi:hypothetical protein
VLEAHLRHNSDPVRESTVVFPNGHSDEIAGQYNQIWMEPVHQFHALANWHNREMLFVMEIAQLGDSKTVELMRKAPQPNINPRYLRMIRRNKSNAASDSSAPYG